MKTLILLAPLLPSLAFGQTALTWTQVRDRFEVYNSTLKAAKANIDEARAGEITANLRPNPTLTTTFDQMTPFSEANSPSTGTPGYRPFAYALPFASFGYLHERDHKRELRLASAKRTTDVAADTFSDQERTLLFNLRNAFVQILQAKAVLQNAKENLEYWDRELDVNRRRFQAGDLAQVDLDRLELQRVQFESDMEVATVNLRTAKIQVLGLLNDRTPIEQFDVSGAFDFMDRLSPVEEYREMALATRPDLRVAADTVELAKANHQLAVANGSTDPTFSVDFARNPPIPVYFGVSITIPLRIFDRNQGERARTEVEVSRSEHARTAAETQVFSDVNSAYATLTGNLNLLRPYRDKYLKLAESSRNRIAFSYQNGGASLLDYLDAQKAYRDTRLAYLNLIGSYLSAAAQLNMAVGREVMP